ncbi:MAG: LytTR family transcriptional regulator [Chitinophagales bacterium]|nr:LytTR family transcriptional regulator [Chitinophagales bacterium]
MTKPIFVWQDKTLRRLLPEQIAFLATEKNYTRIFMTDESFFMVRATLASATKALPKELFIKIHRSFVVSVLHINSIHKDHVEVLGAPVPVARQYYAGLMKRVSVIR